MLESVLLAAVCGRAAASWAPYMRTEGGAVSHGLEGAGTGTGAGSGTTGVQGFPVAGAGVDGSTYGVVVTVVGMYVQHAAESQSPAAHTLLSDFFE